MKLRRRLLSRRRVWELDARFTPACSSVEGQTAFKGRLRGVFKCSEATIELQRIRAPYCLCGAVRYERFEYDLRLFTSGTYLERPEYVPVF